MAIKFSRFVSLCSEAYDADLKGATIRRQRDTAARRKTPAEIKRTKTAVDPETGERKQVPVVQKQRKDAGQARPQSTTSARQQQPTQERGSAQVKQSYAETEKERRRAAARARAAAAKSGGAKPQSSSPSSKDLSKQADKLLVKKKEEPQKQTTRKNVKRTSASDNLTSAEKQKVGYQARRKEFAAKKNQILANLIADYTETHGKPPKGKERTKLVWNANQAAAIK